MFFSDLMAKIKIDRIILNLRYVSDSQNIIRTISNIVGKYSNIWTHVPWSALTSNSEQKDSSLQYRFSHFMKNKVPPFFYIIGNICVAC